MSNLLDKASIILTPTAYDNSEVLCVKPSDGSGDFDFSRNSAATRVNAQGLVEDVQILSSNLIVNGDFATNSNWNFNTGWSYETNKAVSVPSGGGKGINQSVSGKIFSGKTYKIKYTIQDYVSGNVRPSLSGGGTATGTTSNANGTFTQNLIATTNHTTFNIKSTGTSGGFNGSITNVSIIEISQDTNLPRINYDGFSFDGSGNIIPDSGCGSWLFEPQSTNLITYSEDFSQWSLRNGGSIVANSVISPDGTQNASSWITDSTGQKLQKNTSGFTQGNEYTFSIYIKADTNLNVGIGGVDSLVVSVAVTTDWQRFEVKQNATSTTRFPQLQNIGNNGTFYIWGAQVEEQTYATSYIPTDGTSVTRNQDVCNNGGSAASINSTEGVLYAEIAALANDGTNKAISINNGGTSDYLFFRYRSNNQFQVIFRSGSSNIVNTIITLSNNLDFNKIAFSYKLNEFKLFVNGLQIGSTITSGVVFGTTINSLDFDEFNGTNNFFGKTKCLAVFPYLTDTELAELTTI